MRLIELLSTPITCATITIMLYDCTYEVNGKEYDDYKYHIQLKHTHKRMMKNMERLALEHGYKDVVSLELRDKLELVIKIK